MFACSCISLVLSLLVCLSTSSFPSRLLKESVHLDEIKQLQVFFERHLNGVNDPSKIHNALIGLESVGLSPENPENVCKVLQKKPDTKSEMFHRVCGASILGDSCKVPPDVKLLEKTELDATSADELFQDVMIRKCAGLHIDSPHMLKVIGKIATGDKSPNSIALILQIATQLDLKTVDANGFISSISIALQQADEIEGMLFYEKGLYTTAMVAIGVFEFINKYGSVTDVSEAQLTKLLNFVLTRRYSNNLRAAAHLRKAIQLAMRNRIVMPVVFEVVSSGDVGFATGGALPNTNPLLQVKLVTLSGQPVTGETVSLTAHGLHAVPDGTLVGPTERGLFVYDKVESTFHLPLAVSSNEFPPRGYYWIELDVSWKVANETRAILGGTNVRLPLRIVTNASVVSSKITIFDAVHERHVSDIILKPGELYSAGTPSRAISLDLEHQARLTVHLAEAATGGAADRVPLLAHQVFVQLTHQTTRQAITFVCNKAAASQVASGSQAYELLLDPKKSSVDFDNLPGVYKMELIVGDSLISRPLVWHMLDLELRFIGQSGEESQRRASSAQDVSRRQLASAAASKAARSMLGTGPELVKPTIEHIFRPSEKRAPRLLATVFTLACLVPFLGLLVAWGVIGLNLGNFVFSLSGLVFHAGLVAIFCLYYVYWCYLDMFTTLGYLAVIGVPTFLAGNSLLRGQLVLRSALQKK